MQLFGILQVKFWKANNANYLSIALEAKIASSARAQIAAASWIDEPMLKFDRNSNIYSLFFPEINKAQIK